jgi:hypothetical protein
MVTNRPHHTEASEEEMLLRAVSADIGARFELAGIEFLPLTVQLVLVTDPEEAVRGSMFAMRTLEPAAVRLAEQRESNPSLRRDVARQRHASLELKRSVPLHELFEDAVKVALDDAGLTGDAKEHALEQWRAHVPQESGETLGELLDRV